MTREPAFAWVNIPSSLGYDDVDALAATTLEEGALG
jgi:hypothetical protein